MKLLYIHHESPFRNKANIIQVLQMCYSFEKMGIDTTLAIPAPKNISKDEVIRVINSKLNKKVYYKIVTYPIYTIANRGANLGIIFGVKPLLKKMTDFDIYFTRDVLVNDIVLKLGYKIIYESHATTLSRGSKLVNKFLTNKLLQNSKKKGQAIFITISKALANYWIERGVPSEKVLVLHDAVSNEDFNKVPKIEDAKRDMGFSKEKKTVLYAGRLYADRGIEHILKLADIYPSVDFLILGGPQIQKDKYENIAKSRKLNNVIFKGQIPHHEVKNYLFASDILLMLWSWQVPTIHICSPLKVFEYMAAERIIVGQAFPTIKEVCEDGVNSFLADPDSFDDLKDKLGKALETSYPNEMSRNARKLVLEKYTWEKRSKLIIAFLKDNKCF